MLLTERFEDALVYATRVHSDHVRKGSGVPYVSHLLAVTALVIEAGGDEDEVIAALLHDAVEDRGGPQRLEEIRERFGDRVADTVDGCTDGWPDPGTGDKAPWRDRKEAHVATLADPATSRSVRLVSLADKLHNARALVLDYRRLGDGLWERFNAGGDDILWYQRAVADALVAWGDLPLAEELARVVSELEALTSSPKPCLDGPSEAG